MADGLSRLWLISGLRRLWLEIIRWSPFRVQAVKKIKSSKRDENDILDFDFKIECACDVGT